MKSITRRIGRDTGYLLASFPIALPAFIIAVAGFAAGISTAIIWVGVPILAATLFAMRGFAAAGRGLLAGVTDEPVEQPRYRTEKPEASGLRRFLGVLADGPSWLNLLWGVLNFPLAIAGFVVALTWWAATVASLAYPAYAWIIRRATGGDDGLEHATRWLGWGDSYAALSALAVLGGLVMLVLLPLVLRGFAFTQAALSRSLLTTVDGSAEDESPRFASEVGRVRTHLVH